MSGDQYPVTGQELSPTKMAVQSSAGGKVPVEKDAVSRNESNAREEPNASQTSASSSDQNENQMPATDQKPDQNGQISENQSPEVPLVDTSEGNTMAKKAAKTGNKDAKKAIRAATPPEEKTAPLEAYYAPNEVPLFKKLQKKRLSGTRTKQLLRAASRAHDDPPPPPELGTCCGSSCDPCVNDIWKEERDVWRERWGDRAVEGDGKRKELEW
ncbi:unnamed protein product [Penicillium manginii]